MTANVCLSYAPVATRLGGIEINVPLNCWFFSFQDLLF